MKKYKNNKKSLKISLAVLLLVISIGYALLNANLTINGTSNFARTTWNIHFENLQDNTNMTLGQNDSAAAITQNKTNEVTYSISFNEPGQFYEFEVDAKNDGTIDGMVNAVTSTIKIGNGEATPITTNPSNLPAYLSYTATYSDGLPIEQYHLLAASTKETYKVRVEFRTDIEATDLPGTDETIELTFGVEYIQKDSNGIPVPHQFVGPVAPVTNYVVSDINMYIGEAIPNGVNIRNTPELAMTDWLNIPNATETMPFYINHKIENNVITETYIEFIINDELKAQWNSYYCNSEWFGSDNPDTIALCQTGHNKFVNGTYRLRGGVDESSLEEGNQPIYEANRAVLLQANPDCVETQNDISISSYGLTIVVDDSGDISVSNDNGYCVPSYQCIFENISNNASSCYFSENC